MTGPDHYRQAETCARQAAASDEGGQLADAHIWIGLGQLHATLALAAATALGREGEGRTMASKDRAAWFDVAAECKKPVAA